MCTIISWCRQADTLQLSVGAEPQGLSDAAAQTEGRWGGGGPWPRRKRRGRSNWQ